MRDLVNRYAWLIAADVLLIGANLALTLGYSSPAEFIDRQFDLTLEGNFAVWFSSLQLAACALIAVVIGMSGRPAGLPGVRWKAGWFATAAIFAAISMDEASQVHEWIGYRAGEWLGRDVSIFGLPLQGTFLWPLVLGPFIIAAGVWLYWFLRWSFRGMVLPRVLASTGVGVWVIVIAAEVVEAYLRSVPGASRGWQAPVEEGAELIGALLFLIALLEYLRRKRFRMEMDA